MKEANIIKKEKRNAAKAAVEYISSNSIVGLGTGSTTKFAIDYLGDKIKNGQLTGISAVSSSIASQNQAEQLGITILDINSIETIDITIDGADEFDNQLNLIKGGGGALLREKILASFSKEVIIISDSQKQVKQLGKFPLPIEVMQLAVNPILKKLQSLNLNPKIRKDKNGETFVSDNSNFIIDLNLGLIKNINDLDQVLKSIPGIIENGLFIGYATKLLMGEMDQVKVFEKMTSR